MHCEVVSKDYSVETKFHIQWRGLCPRRGVHTSKECDSIKVFERTVHGLIASCNVAKKALDHLMRRMV